MAVFNTSRVTAVNDSPVATAQSVTTAEDTAVTITLAGTDADGDALTYTVVNQPSNGTLSGTAPNLTYTSNANYPNVHVAPWLLSEHNYNGDDSFTFKVNDGTSDSKVATVSITVTAVNDPPCSYRTGGGHQQGPIVDYPSGGHWCRW